jgi:hypothetical protein
VWVAAVDMVVSGTPAPATATRDKITQEWRGTAFLPDPPACDQLALQAPRHSPVQGSARGSLRAIATSAIRPLFHRKAEIPIVLRGGTMELRVCGLIAAFAISCLFNSTPAQAQFAQQGPKLAGANAPAGGLQGYAVSLSGDGNTAIVGAPQSFSRDFGSLTGAAWVFTHSGGVWMQQQEILSPYGIDFGFSVALSADRSTAIIGAPTDVSDNEGYAAVYGR